MAETRSKNMLWRLAAGLFDSGRQRIAVPTPAQPRCQQPLDSRHHSRLRVCIFAEIRIIRSD